MAGSRFKTGYLGSRNHGSQWKTSWSKRRYVNQPASQAFTNLQTLPPQFYRSQDAGPYQFVGNVTAWYVALIVDIPDAAIGTTYGLASNWDQASITGWGIGGDVGAPGVIFFQLGGSDGLGYVVETTVPSPGTYIVLCEIHQVGLLTTMQMYVNGEVGGGRLLPVGVTFQPNSLPAPLFKLGHIDPGGYGPRPDLKIVGVIGGDLPSTGIPTTVRDAWFNSILNGNGSFPLIGAPATNEDSYTALPPIAIGAAPDPLTSTITGQTLRYEIPGSPPIDVVKFFENFITNEPTF